MFYINSIKSSTQAMRLLQNFATAFSLSLNKL